MYWAGKSSSHSCPPACTQSGNPLGSAWQCWGTAWGNVAQAPPVLQFQRAASTGLGCCNLLCLSLCATTAVPSVPHLTLLRAHITLSCCAVNGTSFSSATSCCSSTAFWNSWCFWWKSGFLYLNTAVHLFNRKLQSSRLATTASFLLARQREDVWLWKLSQALCFTAGLIAKGIC